MVESRCGIVCSECKHKEATGCGGCTNISKPFWADACPVKSCTEGKEHTHCGQCNDFACDLLNQFSYDKDQGDDGKRIKQCQEWKDESV